MGTLPTLLLRLQEAQNILGDAVAAIADDPRLSEYCRPMNRRLVQLILELQQLESSARELEKGAERAKSL